MILEILFKLLVLWFSISFVVLATAWYGYQVIKPRYPGWWKREIMNDVSELKVDKW